MRRSIAALMTIFCLCAASQQAAADPGPFPEIERLFDSGDYERTAKATNELLLKESELSASQRAALYLMKARLELAFRRTSEIKIWLERSYKSDPNMALDPVKDPPQLLEAWESIKSVTEKKSSSPQSARAFNSTLAPFGLGHVLNGHVQQGVLFASTSVLALVITHDIETPANRADGAARHRFAGISLIGIYGYELLDLSKEMVAANRESARLAHHLLTFLPGGVGQARNGDFGKAWAFAVAQAGFLGASASCDSPSQRKTAFGLFSGLWLYSIVDAWRNEQSLTVENPLDPIDMALLPTDKGLAMTWTYHL